MFGRCQQFLILRTGVFCFLFETRHKNIAVAVLERQKSNFRRAWMLVLSYIQIHLQLGSSILIAWRIFHLEDLLTIAVSFRGYCYCSILEAVSLESEKEAWKRLPLVQTNSVFSFDNFQS